MSTNERPFDPARRPAFSTASGPSPADRRATSPATAARRLSLVAALAALALVGCAPAAGEHAHGPDQASNAVVSDVWVEAVDDGAGLTSQREIQRAIAVLVLHVRRSSGRQQLADPLRGICQRRAMQRRVAYPIPDARVRLRGQQRGHRQALG